MMKVLIGGLCVLVCSVIADRVQSLPPGLKVVNPPNSDRVYQKTSHGGHCHLPMLDGSGASCNVSGRSSSAVESTEIHLSEVTRVAGVVTQGRQHPSAQQWVTKFRLQYMDSGSWVDVEEVSGTPKEFTANTDISSKVYNTFVEVFTDKIKFLVRNSDSNVHASYRTGLLLPEQGCMRPIYDSATLAGPLGFTESDLCNALGTKVVGCSSFCDTLTNMPDDDQVCACGGLTDDVLFTSADICLENLDKCDDDDNHWLLEYCAKSCCLANKRR